VEFTQARYELRTERLYLRGWQPSDREPFAAMNADPRVMEHFVAPLTAAETDQLLERIARQFDADGFGLWVVDIPGVAPFAGFIGLYRPNIEAHFTPCVEVGWRLAAPFWGRGYATEGARAAVQFGFDTVGLTEIVSITVPGNQRSRRVMEKLGMTCRPEDDFDHPRVAAGSPLRRHVLYRLRAATTPVARARDE
jgi:RimJ/RimL family protein N-acetyltransferase